MSPRPRARVDKYKGRRTLEDDLFFYFGIGPKENRFLLRAKWFRHRDDILALWGAGSRPYCWWRFERDMEPPRDEEAYLREHGELDAAEEAELASEKRAEARMTVPEWPEDLRDRVATEASNLLLHLGSHAPDLDEHTQPVMHRDTGALFFVCGTDVLAYRADTAYWWKRVDEDSIAVDAYQLGRRVHGFTLPRKAVPVQLESTIWN